MSFDGSLRNLRLAARGSRPRWVESGRSLEKFDGADTSAKRCGQGFEGESMAEQEMALTRGPGVNWARIWQVLAVVFALYIVEQDVEALLWSMHRLPGAGSLGRDDRQSDGVDPGFGPGFLETRSVEPGSPIAKAGVSAGDHLRFDPAWRRLIYPRAGEIFHITVDHQGQRVQRDVVAVPRVKPPQATETSDATFVLVNLITGLFAVFILWRGGRKLGTLLLGLAISSFSLVWLNPQMWESEAHIFPVLFGLDYLTYAAIFPLFLAFSVRYGEETLGRRRTWEWGLVAAYAALYGGAVGVQAWTRWNIVTLPLVGDGGALAQFLTYPGGAACLYFLFLGWSRSGAVERGRYAFLLIGFAAILISQIIIEYVDLGLNDPNFTANPLLIPANILIGVVAPLLFTYAILRHRVMDLGFAINRTLVYTLVSAILLAAFGLIEWAVDHIVSIDGREKNALVDAAIAVAVFLTFHRVRDLVEHGVEYLFFKQWKKSAETFRQFVRTAAFATRPSSLTRGFAAALTQFADCAPAAVYILEGRAYNLVGGSVPGLGEQLDPDHPALMAIRAEPKVLILEPLHAIAEAAMMVPMVHRNEVIGITVLGAKPSGLDFRPDEVELIGWATNQVGLDLHALKVEGLEASAADLRKTLGALERALSLAAAKA
jgi:hypothetical protein